MEMIYGAPNSRSYSTEDLLSQEQRFAVRALKGIRKGDTEKIRINLLISLSWLMSLVNRFGIDVDATRRHAPAALISWPHLPLSRWKAAR